MPSSGGQTSADRKSTRLNSSHGSSSYAVFCLQKKRLRCLGGLLHRVDARRGVVVADEEERCGDGQPDQRAEVQGAGRGGEDVDVFFFNDTATTEIYTLSLHDALPICEQTQRHHALAHWFAHPQICG